jgi:hypothetical protein
VTEPSVLLVGLLILGVITTNTVGYVLWKRGALPGWWETALLTTGLAVLLTAERVDVLALAAVASHAAVGLYGLMVWLKMRTSPRGRQARR